MRYAVRLLTRQPGHAVVAIMTMALGIGATIAVFSVVYGVLLKPLPWPDADRIFRVAESRRGHEARLGGTISNGAYYAWREQPTTIEAIGGYSLANNMMTALRSDAAEPVRLPVASLTPAVFDILRARPLRGRILVDADVPLPGDDMTPRAVVISFGLWQEWFGGADVLGRVIRLDNVPFTVVGVMPRRFAFPNPDTRAWTPMSIPTVLGDEHSRRMMVFGALVRLKPGVSPQQAAAEGTARANSAPDPGFAAVAMFGSDAPPEISVTRAASAMTAEVKPAILLLLAGVALLFLTATANVGSIQMARATTRRRELAIRAAIGARTSALVRQLVVESAVLGAAGGSAGFIIAFAIDRVLPRVLPADFPRVSEIGVNVPVFIFAVAASMAAGVACGLLPVIPAMRLNTTDVLGEGGPSSTGGAGRWRSIGLRTAIMTGQITIACVLLVAAALLGRAEGTETTKNY